MRSFEGEAMTHGGVTLDYHWQNGARDVIRTGDFDVVVLQGYLPGAETHTAEPFLEHARLLHEAVRGSGAETVFFMTWPQGFNDWSDMTTSSMRTARSRQSWAYRWHPAALAFELAKAERPELGAHRRGPGPRHLGRGLPRGGHRLRHALRSQPRGTALLLRRRRRGRRVPAAHRLADAHRMARGSGAGCRGLSAAGYSTRTREPS